MVTEEWRCAVGFEGYYEVSNFGNVRRADSCKVLDGGLNSYGYKVFSLSKDGKQYMSKGHRLVAQAFIPNPENKRNVNHIDGDKSNNFVENLEWSSQRENGIHAREVLSIDYSQKPVVQTTINGEVVAIWASGSVAGRVLNIAQQLIGACCRGTAPTAGNFIWRYSGISFERAIKEQRVTMMREKVAQLSHEISTLEQDLA